MNTINFKTSAFYFGSGKTCSHGNKRVKAYQLGAADTFCAWAEFLSIKLESIVDSQTDFVSFGNLIALNFQEHFFEG